MRLTIQKSSNEFTISDLILMRSLRHATDATEFIIENSEKLRDFIARQVVDVDGGAVDFEKAREFVEQLKMSEINTAVVGINTVAEEISQEAVNPPTPVA